MKTVAAVFADFVTAPAGGPAQLGTPLAGTPILARTLGRLMEVEGLAARALLVQPRDREAAGQAVAAAGLAGRVDVLPLAGGPRPREQLIRAARKWNLESWRGGLLGLSWFDEFADARAAAAVLAHYRAEAVLCLDGHQPLLDPGIASAQLAHAREQAELARFVFTQAPPGLAGIVLRPAVLEDLLRLNIPLGLLLAYRPEIAQSDPITHPSCCHVAPGVAQCAARLTGDTRRSRELLEAALRDLGESAAAVDLCGWLRAPGHDRAGPLPVEVELELTTDDPLPDTTLRPRGARVPRRHLADLDAVARLAAELAAYDDRLVFLGGHGDPLCHPQFAEVCQRLRAAGVYGLAVGTHLVDLPDAAGEALFAAPVDVVEVRLDAVSPEQYARAHGRDAHGRVIANIERLEQRRRAQAAPRPIVVCSFTRSAATIPELETFYDHWVSRLGSAVIHGYNDFCGSLPPDDLLPTVPSVRGPCRRLATRLMLLADGTVAGCAQDIHGRRPLGDWRVEPLAAVWTGPALARLRAAHAALELEGLADCRRCTEWARP